MSIAIICNKKDPQPWFKKLSSLLPDTKIEIYPNIKYFDDVTFLVCWKAHKGDFEKFPNVKVIHSLGASVSHIFDIYKVPEHIKVAKIVDANLSEDMFEFLLAGILAEMKSFNNYSEDKAVKLWNPRPYQRIKNTVISFLGAGSIGLHCAKKFRDLGFEVNLWSKSVKDKQGLKSFTGKNGLKEMLSTTDFLISLLPLTKETKEFIDESIFKNLKKGAYFINAGRGEQLVDNDLIKFIDNGNVSGALLDVFHEEPLPKNHPFWKHKKVRITPHVASVTDLESASQLIADNYKKMLNSKEITNIVSQQKGY